jgi:hypothetical protein
MKKIFAQPEMMVVNVKSNDIVTASRFAPLSDDTQANEDALAPGMRGIFDPYDAGY